MTSIFIILAIIIGGFYIVKKYKKRSPKTIDVSPNATTDENLNEPIISYSIYTVDTVLNHRYLNYTHKDFPNHVGILKGQYLEIDWNIINADLITISGIGLVKAVGRKAFYPTQNTSYLITAKNGATEVQVTIFVRIFPQTISDKLKIDKPTIQSSYQQIIMPPTVSALPSFEIEKPVFKASKPDVTPLQDVLKNKIKIKTFTQKIHDYIFNQSTKK